MAKSDPTRKEGLTTSLEVLVPGGDESDFRGLVSRLYAVSSRLQSMRRELAKHLGLGATDWSVLLTLQTEAPLEGAMRIREVAEHLHVAAANVTAAVNSLEKRGFVEKREDSRDARAIAVSLSPDGREAMKSLIGKLRDVNDVWFSGMSEEEFHQANILLNRLLHQFDAAYAVSKINQR